MFIAASLMGAEKPAAVLFNGLSSRDGALMNYPGVSLEKEYGIAVRQYWPGREYVEQLLKRTKTDETPAISYDDWEVKNKDSYKSVDGNFAADLEKSRLLYIGQRAGESASIPFKKYPEAIKKFLAAGGVIFFDYSSTTPTLNDFLKSVGVTNPSTNYKDLKPGEYGAIPWAGNTNLLLLNRPNNLSKEQGIPAYGWWEKWADNQSAPFRNQSEPEKRAALIIQENVSGKGKIIFNQVSCIFLGPEKKGNKRMLENMLSFIFERNILECKKEMLAEQGGPGEPAK